MSVDRIFLARNVARVEESPEFDVYTGVRIIVGETESGAQLTYEAGNDAGLMMEITNPWGTQEMANDILATLSGYNYKPYTASGALLTPAAELGDAVSVDEVYSVLANIETSYNAIMPSTISAPDDGDIDHEYPFEQRQDRELTRKIYDAKVSLTVRMNEIVGWVEDNYQVAGNYVTTQTVNTLIGQYVDSQAGTAKIINACSGTYQRSDQMGAYVLANSLNTSIGQYIDSQAGTAKIESAISGTYQTIAGMSDYVLNNQLNNSITQYVNSTSGQNEIIATVSGSYAGKSYENTVTLNQQKLSWLIESGTSASNFQMTDRAIQLVAETINLSGYVTFNALASAGSTSINGGNITTGTISADRIDVNNLKVRQIYAPYPYDFPLVYTSFSVSDYRMAIGSDTAAYRNRINRMYLVAINEVYMKSSSSATGLVFDTGNRVISGENNSYKWTLGAIAKPFSDVIAFDVNTNAITFRSGQTSSSVSADVKLTYGTQTTSGVGGYALIPDYNGRLSLGTFTSRLQAIFVNHAYICNSTGKLCFFTTSTTSASAKQTLSLSSTNMGYSSVTSSNYLVALNNLIGILAGKYNLIGV